MVKTDVLNRLKLLDMAAYTKIKDTKRYSCVIVGGGALMLLGFSNRVTYDIDILKSDIPKELFEIMQSVDYKLLNELAEDVKYGMLNDYDVKMFEHGYNDFIKKAKEDNLCVN